MEVFVKGGGLFLILPCGWSCGGLLWNFNVQFRQIAKSIFLFNVIILVHKLMILLVQGLFHMILDKVIELIELQRLFLYDSFALTFLLFSHLIELECINFDNFIYEEFRLAHQDWQEKYLEEIVFNVSILHGEHNIGRTVIFLVQIDNAEGDVIRLILTLILWSIHRFIRQGNWDVGGNEPVICLLLVKKWVVEKLLNFWSIMNRLIYLICLSIVHEFTILDRSSITLTWFINVFHLSLKIKMRWSHIWLFGVWFRRAGFYVMSHSVSLFFHLLKFKLTTSW